MTALMRRLFRLLIILLCLIPAALLLYTLAAFGALLWPRPVTIAETNLVIYACDNGVHTDLVLPVNAGGVDWRQVFPPGQFAAPITEFDHVNIGWGSRDFYLNTPTWADVEIGRALKALLWDETVLRVDYRWRPQPGEACGMWRVSVADFGRIAAANAFSDIYAMGAAPLFALNLVGWPRDKLPFDLLGDVLRGGQDIAAAAGAFILGGHSIDDPEPKYGMVVLGEVHPDRLVTNARARPGDAPGVMRDAYLAHRSRLAETG